MTAKEDHLTTDEIHFLVECLDRQPIEISRDFVKEDLENAARKKLKRMLKKAASLERDEEMAAKISWARAILKEAKVTR
jgi:hypothetical protein